MNTRLQAMLLLATTALAAGSAAANDHRWHEWSAGPSMSPWSLSYPLEGTWDVKVEITNCADGSVIVSFDAMALFARGGTFHDTNANNPALRSDAFGVWRHLKGRKYEFAFRLFRFDPAGNNLGSQIVRHTVTLDRSGDSYTSEGTAEYFEANGEPASVPPAGCSRSTATRFE